MKSDIEIAQNAKMEPIVKIAEKLGVLEDEIEQYGKYKCKISLDIMKKNENKTNSLKNNDSINFGSQIRSYILEPYKLVKDHRTNYESSDPESILDGNINDMLLFNLKGIK